MNKKIMKHLIFTVVLTITLVSLGLATPPQEVEIRTCGELQAIENDLTGRYVILENIDCEGYNFEPIGNFENPFQGELYGRNNLIRGLNLTEDGNGDLGLFRVIGEEGEVRNIQLAWPEIKSSSNDVGAIAGQNWGLIKGSKVAFGTVEGSSFVGGMVGYMTLNGRIINSGVTSTEVSGDDAVGGLLGYNFGGVVNTSRAGFAPWNPSPLEANGYGAGGLVGVNDDESKIINSYANVDVQGSEEVGGLVGRQTGHSVWETVTKNSYSIGPVSGEYESTTGGLIGYQSGDYSHCSANFWDIDTSNQQNSECGTGKPTEEMQEKTTYTDAGWDFENIWEIEEDNYPKLAVRRNYLPLSPTDPSPEDKAQLSPRNSVELSVYVEDKQGKDMDVTFYNAKDNTQICTDEQVESKSRASCEWINLEEKEYKWFAVADDGELASKSNVWSFEIKEDGEEYYTLTTNIIGEGSLEIDPDQEEYKEGTEVEITAIADEDWYFEKWTGDHSCTDEEITITMNEDKEITAHFTEKEITKPNAKLPDQSSRLGTSHTFRQYSYDSKGNITDYEWDLSGNGCYDDATGPKPTLTWSELKELGIDRLGDHLIRLRVTNDRGKTDTDHAILKITSKSPKPPEETPPEADAGLDQEGYVNETIQFEGKGYTSEGHITRYRWDFNNNGTWEYESNETGKTNHTYPEPGLYKAKLEVENSQGYKDIDTAEVYIREKVETPDENIVRYFDLDRQNQVRITAVYRYDHEKNTTNYQITLESRAYEGKNYRITTEVPKSVATHIDQLKMNPKPDEVILQNPVVAWETPLAVGEMTRIEIEKEGYVPSDYYEDIRINIEEIEVEEEPEIEDEEDIMTTITGMVMGAFAHPGQGLVILIILITLALAYRKREYLKQQIKIQPEKE